MKIIPNILNLYKKNWKEITGAVISVSAIIVTVLQFLSYRENEFRKSLFTEQFQIYEELLEKTSVLCHFNKDTIDKPMFENALKEYEQFQKGKLMLVTENRVKEKVKYFVNRAKNFFNTNIENTSLQNTLDSISTCCRLSLQETFNVSLPDLSLNYNEEELTEFDTTFDNSE